jgi:hypothetical protein
MSFKRAVGLSTSNLSGDSSSDARLSRWLSYSSTYSDRIPLVADYSPQNGMAFGTSLNDPDNSQVVSFSTSGIFTNYGSGTHQFGSSSPKVTLVYVPQAAVTITGFGNSTLGYIRLQDSVGTVTLTDEPFQLTITQTSPWPATDCP